MSYQRSVVFIFLLYGEVKALGAISKNIPYTKPDYKTERDN